MKSLSRVRFFATPWTVPYQTPPSMGFCRQEYWSGLPFPSPRLYISAVVKCVPFALALPLTLCFSPYTHCLWDNPPQCLVGGCLFVPWVLFCLSFFFLFCFKTPFSYTFSSYCLLLFSHEICHSWCLIWHSSFAEVSQYSRRVN